MRETKKIIIFNRKENIIEEKNYKQAQHASHFYLCLFISFIYYCFISHSSYNFYYLYLPGNKLISHIVDCQSREAFLSQDIHDAKETIKNNLNEIESEQTAVTVSWTKLEKSLNDAKELMQLEEGVSYVTNWILSTAESLLNGQLKVGYDVQSTEKLRLDHEILEFQCWKTYGYYGELLYKIDNFPGSKESFAFKDLLSQRDFMDFVCRSFATRLERRRNLFITSVRFYRLVAEYFQRTSNVFESLLQTQNENMDNFELAKVKLQKIKDSQVSLGKHLIPIVLP